MNRTSVEGGGEGGGEGGPVSTQSMSPETHDPAMAMPLSPPD